MSKVKLSVIIPVYNEEQTLSEIINKVSKVELDKIKKDIVVVDDASTDGTRKILSELKNIKVVRHKKNLGKGAAVVSGIKASNGEIILIQDADLEYNPNDYKKLLKPIINGKYDVVYGSRLQNYPLRITGAQKTPLILHYLGNKLLSLITSLLYITNISDMETCYKVFRRNVLEGVKINARKFDFEAEITAKLLKKGYEIFEIPIKVKPRGYNEGKKITWKDGFVALWTLIKYRFID